MHLCIILRTLKCFPRFSFPLVKSAYLSLIYDTCRKRDIVVTILNGLASYLCKGSFNTAKIYFSTEKICKKLVL